MIRIAICDDEEQVCSLLERNIVTACELLNIENEIDIYTTGSKLKEDLKANVRYNIYFLDIELINDTGISISECIRNEVNDESAQIIYVSGKNEYDRQLFAFRPFAFIEKPFSEDTIKSNIEKYIRIYGDRNNLFHYKYGHDTYWVHLDTILYFKSNRRKTEIFTLSGSDEFYGSIEKVAETLSKQGFFSPHKSYLVNYQFIKSFQSDHIIMVNGDEIPIAKGKREKISRLQLHFENGGHEYEYHI